MRWKKASLLYIASIAVSLIELGLFVSGGLLATYRRYVGAVVYWVSILPLAVILGLHLDFKIAVLLMSLGLAAGIFVEAKLLDCGDLKAGLISILSTIGVGSLALGIWLQRTQIDFVSALKTELEKNLDLFQSVYGELAIDVDVFLMQIPSLLVIVLILYIWAGIGVERMLRGRFFSEEVEAGQYPVERVEDGSLFRLPDWMIWPTLATIGGRFIELDTLYVNEIATNVFNVLLLVYFFQGIAVVASFLKANEVPPLWRIFWYALMFNMYIVVSMLGFFDYWVDFRKKILSSRDKINAEK